MVMYIPMQCPLFRRMLLMNLLMQHKVDNLVLYMHCIYMYITVKMNLRLPSVAKTSKHWVLPQGFNLLIKRPGLNGTLQRFCLINYNMV